MCSMAATHCVATQVWCVKCSNRPLVRSKERRVIIGSLWFSHFHYSIAFSRALWMRNHWLLVICSLLLSYFNHQMLRQMRHWCRSSSCVWSWGEWSWDLERRYSSRAGPRWHVYGWVCFHWRRRSGLWTGHKWKLVSKTDHESSQHQTDECALIFPEEVDKTFDRLIINTWQYTVFTGFFLMINYSHCQCEIMRE